MIVSRYPSSPRAPRSECHHANRQTWYWRAVWFLLHAVMCKLLDDICREFLRCGDVSIAFDCLALLKLGKAASIEGTCQLRIQLQRRTIVGDGRVPLAQLQVNQPTRVEGGGDIRLQTQRLVAIRQRRL